MLASETFSQTTQASRLNIKVGDGDGANSLSTVMTLHGENQTIDMDGYIYANDTNRAGGEVPGESTPLPILSDGGVLKYSQGGRQHRRKRDLGTLDFSVAPSMSLGDPIPYGPGTPGTGGDPLDGLLYEGGVNNVGSGDDTLVIELADNLKDALTPGDEIFVSFKIFSVSSTTTIKFRYSNVSSTVQTIYDPQGNALTITSADANAIYNLKFMYWNRDDDDEYGLWPLSAIKLGRPS